MFELNRTYTTDTARRIAEGGVAPTPTTSTSTALTVIGTSPVARVTSKALVVLDAGVKEVAAPERVVTAAVLGVPVGLLAAGAVATDLVAMAPAVALTAVTVVAGAAVGKRVAHLVKDIRAPRLIGKAGELVVSMKHAWTPSKKV